MLNFEQIIKNLVKRVIASLLILSVFGLVIPSAFSENVPGWVKNTAGWWATDKISETEFLNAIEFLVNKKIIQVSDTTSDKDGSGYVPIWIKNNAGWWADGQIDDNSFILGLQWLITNGIVVVEEKIIHTDVDFRVAFIGDQGLNSNSIAVLNLIKDEGAQMVLHQGDFDYEDDPDAWDKMISNVLGDDFPYFGTVGFHDKLKWNEYQKKLDDRLRKNPDVNCIGDLGVKSSCIYKGLYFIQVSPGLIGTGHSSFIENQLNNNDHIWRVCSWAKVMHDMQLGQKEDTAGWEVYENCKNGGAIIATGHEHSYHRTKTLIDIENQIVDPEWSDPDKLRVQEGSTFVFISGIGGHSIRDQDRCLPTSYPYGCNGEWASVYTSDQNADFGAMFCTFNAGGNPNKADCYFKNIQGKIIDKFTITNFVGIDDTNSNLPEIDLSNKNLSGQDLTGTILIGTNLTGVNLTGVDLSVMDLTSANLSGQDLSSKDLTKTILSAADLSDTILPYGILSEKNFVNTKFNRVDLSGKDLSSSNFQYAKFKNANLQNTNLTDSKFIQVDFTNIKNKSLAGADLSETSFAYSNLSGVDMSGVILEATNFLKADLSDQDFTIASVITDGLTFNDATLSNSNFEGLNLSPKQQYSKVFKDQAYLIRDVPQSEAKESIRENLFGKQNALSIISAEVHGNDLIVNYFFFNNFNSANLENANFKNANLNHANFYQANLTNADLSGADLRKAFLLDADLSNANLDGAILDGAVLTCKNHPICLND